ncbi:MAG: energy transducer TonB [Alphaproteobacteria bacterium]|nr:energy transducer TonB [Alphaproteobacteria bacterium]
MRAQFVERRLNVSVIACAVALILGVSSGQSAADAPPPVALTDKEILESPIEKPPLRYPQAAYEADIEGEVTVEVVLAPDGTVRSANVLKVDPPGWGFEEATLQSVKKWRFKAPGRELKFRTIVTFKIPAEFTEPPAT